MKTETELTLWGLPSGKTDRLFEKVLTSTTDAARVAKVRELATRDGWHSFRVTKLAPPVFGRASLA